MGSFIDFLHEDADMLNQIQTIIDSFSAEDLDEFGYYLYCEFFDDDDHSDADGTFFEKDDVMGMISALGSDMYPDILDMLSEDGDTDDEVHPGALDEGVSRVMLSTNRNRKTRKFMALSRSKLQRNAAARKRLNRQNKGKTKRYYQANKAKILAYQKSRRLAIKTGKHVVKTRRNGG